MESIKTFINSVWKWSLLYRSNLNSFCQPSIVLQLAFDKKYHDFLMCVISHVRPWVIHFEKLWISFWIYIKWIFFFFVLFCCFFSSSAALNSNWEHLIISKSFSCCTNGSIKHLLGFFLCWWEDIKTFFNSAWNDYQYICLLTLTL